VSGVAGECRVGVVVVDRRAIDPTPLRVFAIAFGISTTW
jgi:hypothetical protein